MPLKCKVSLKRVLVWRKKTAKKGMDIAQSAAEKGAAQAKSAAQGKPFASQKRRRGGPPPPPSVSKKSKEPPAQTVAPTEISADFLPEERGGFYPTPRRRSKKPLIIGGIAVILLGVLFFKFRKGKSARLAQKTAKKGMDIAQSAAEK